LNDLSELVEQFSRQNSPLKQEENEASKAVLNPLKSLPQLRFSVTTEIIKSNRDRKTGNYLSTFDLCKTLGIDYKTYQRHEGTLFPLARRDPRNGFRIFTKQELNQLKILWNKRAEYLSSKRHYHYHKTQNFYSLLEVCRIVRISRKTFQKYEGKLFPMAWRDDKMKRRLFTDKDVRQIKEAWEKHKSEK
jgi:DNA-binding transcriptional MerR regulator